MKSVEFDEEHLLSRSELITTLFEDENDPRSNAYKRVLYRPQIRWIRIAAYLLIPIAVLIGLRTLLVHLGLSAWLVTLVIMMSIMAYIIIMSKRTVICAVRIYQRFAPDAVRNRCRFEPSCSEYMILAIEKYGLIIGVRRGINRLRRCNVNGGGFDMP